MRRKGRAGGTDRPRGASQEALETSPPTDDFYNVLLDYAEFLRKQGETSTARTLLARAVKDAPRSFRSEVEFFFARLEGQASVFRHAVGRARQNRFGEATAAFEGGEKSATSPVERARHAYWRARALTRSGEEREGGELPRARAAWHGGGAFQM